MIAREPAVTGDATSTSPPAPSLRAAIAVIATGLFATGLGWPGLIGQLPFSLLLKNQLQLPPQHLATFWAVATAPWYVKPLVGLVCDAYPLLGTRRRGYLLAGASVSGLLWLGFAVVPHAYGPLLATMTALNATMVFVSAALGGLLVEVGQRHGATGRLSALRSGLV